MYYTFTCEDVENSLELRQANRPVHMERLNALLSEGRLLLAGANPAIDNPDPGPAGFTGSLIIAEFDCLEDAQAWADAEPFLLAGVYKSITVKPFRKALP